MSGPLLLAVESSCDETGIALVEGGRRIHANVVASQVALHAPTGGIVPEVAARAHLRWIVPVLDEALATAGVTMADVDGVAVTYGPGLAGSLLVGINFAKTLAWAHGKPLVPVNHLEGHVYAGWLPIRARRSARCRRSRWSRWWCRADTRSWSRCATTSTTGSSAPRSTTPPARRSTRSGGCWVSATRVDRPSAWPPRGRSRGTASSRGPGWATRTTSRSRVSRPRRGGSWRRRAPTRACRPTSARAAPLPDAVVAELAWGFQDSVVDVLATKTIRAAEEVGARGIVMGGGVASNAALRDAIAGGAAARGIGMVIPRPGLCTDNGAMIGAAGARRFAAGVRAGLDLDARPSLPLAR